MKIRRFSSLILATALLPACAQMQRSSRSGYGDKQNETYAPPTKEYAGDRDRQRTAYEMGLSPSAELSGDDRGRINARQRVRELEKGLKSQKEREQYSKVLPWFRSDDEKAEFLSVPTLEGRQQWVNSHGIWERAKMPAPEMKELIETQDISVGMPRDYVKKSWGEPLGVEVSGNPIYHNERWKYQRFISTPDGYKKEVRFVYFESGRVVGWETE